MAEDFGKAIGFGFSSIDRSAPLAKRFYTAMGRDLTVREALIIFEKVEAGATPEAAVDAFIAEKQAERGPAFEASEVGQALTGTPTEETGVITDPALSGAAPGAAPGPGVGLDALGLGVGAQAAESTNIIDSILGSSLSEEELAALQGAQEETAELVSGGTLTGMMFAVEQREAQRIYEVIREPLARSPKDVRALQRNLVAAGYLNPDSVKPGWYDGAVADAYSRALIDASIRNVPVENVLRQRILQEGLLKDKEALKNLRASEMEEQAHREALSNTYFDMWGQSPPPGYIDSVFNMNPDELAFYESSKDAWADSPVGQIEQSYMADSLDQFLNSSQFAQQQADFESGSGVFQGAAGVPEVDVSKIRPPGGGR